MFIIRVICIGAFIQAREIPHRHTNKKTSCWDPAVVLNKAKNGRKCQAFENDAG